MPQLRYSLQNHKIIYKMRYILVHNALEPVIHASPPTRLAVFKINGFVYFNASRELVGSSTKSEIVRTSALPYDA